MTRFEATRGLFWDGPLNLGPRSDDEDDTGEGTSPPNFSITQAGGHFPSQQAHIPREFSIQPCFDLEPSCLETETLPLGYRAQVESRITYRGHAFRVEYIQLQMR
ncbi:hypothetical protein AVEN_108342-1 [Araneus ventricosus]|uniref:Uncharacterized protein n=1 Tax=Araneus ventricosus TaxID=182803 RepID=A0A4Y2N987_ARAVE|nr:hypothetical protein AVEN_108342-1 [Araneus ventricosus]